MTIAGYIGGSSQKLWLGWKVPSALKALSVMSVLIDTRCVQKNEGHQCNMNRNHVCFRSSHVLLAVVVVALVVSLLMFQASQRGPRAVTVTPTPVSVERKGIADIPSTVILQRPDTHISSDWALAPRGNYRYASSPIQTPIQVGLLTGSVGTTQLILPLYKRSSPTNRNRYQYFTRTDTHNPQDITVLYNKRDCSTEMGCDEIFDKDTVTLPAYSGQTFNVSLYPN